MVWYIYKTTCIINGKIYVGKHCTKKDSVDRAYLGSGKLLWLAINKYGKENFVQEIIEFNSSEEENCLREQFWISKLKSQDRNIGYNISPGGEGGISGFNRETNKWFALERWSKLTKEEHRARVEKMQKAAQSLESKKKISEASKAFHRNMTDEERKIYSKACSDGWSLDERKKAGKRLSDRNKNLKGLSMKEVFQQRYGEIEGQKHYDDYIKKQREAALKNAANRKLKSKQTLEKKKQFPKYKEYCLQTAKVQQMRTSLKRGKITQDEFNASYKNEVNLLNELKKELRRFLDDFNNGEAF